MCKVRLAEIKIIIKMKIVHITYMLTFGGIETMLVNIANEQVKAGHEVEVIIVERGLIDSRLSQMLDPSIKLHMANRKKDTKDLLAVARINWFLLRANPDAIHIHASGLMRCIVLPGHRRITCSTLHDLPFDKNTVAIRTVPRVFAISEAVRKALKENYGVESKAIPNGIHPERIRVRTSGAKHDVFRIVMVSRLQHEKKGQDILIDALAELKQKGYHHIVVDLIGDGASRAFLEERCKTKGVVNEVRFLGTRPQEYVFEHFRDYDLFVQPSRHEGFALTVAEAMAARVPVLVASGQGPEEVIDYGRCGYVFQNGDVQECADRIEQIIRNGEDVNKTDKAYERVWKLYNVSVTASTYLKNYLWKNDGERVCI